jgi:uroporphyrinogen decarboxylase
MTSRDRIIKTLRRKNPDKVPMYFELTPPYEHLFTEKTGKNASEYQTYFNFDMVTLEPAMFFKPKSDYLQFYPDEDLSKITINEWGIGYKKGSIHHFESLVHPLRNAQTAEDLLNYPYPEISGINEPDFIHYCKSIVAAHDKGLAVMSRGQAVGGTIFWPAYKLRGMEQLFIDMYENSELLTALLDKVTEMLIDVCVKKANAGVDVLLLADDFGTQINLMMSMEHWKFWFRDRIMKVIKAVKRAKPDIIVAFHSDGAVEKLIPQLLEIGVDVLNPIQPECMNPIEIKHKYGERLSLWGTVGTQTTMPFGKPEDVKQCVMDMISGCGRNGGLLIGPTHVLEPEVPWENLIRFVESVEKYGKY